MDNCFAACDDNKGITKADFDRFTDVIENVLNDKKGRLLFRNFMFTAELKDGRRTLDFWEHVEKLLSYKAKGISPRNYLEQIDRIILETEKIDELGFATIHRLKIALQSKNQGNIFEALEVLKGEAAKALKREYDVFRSHLVKHSPK